MEAKAAQENKPGHTKGKGPEEIEMRVRFRPVSLLFCDLVMISLLSTPHLHRDLFFFYSVFFLKKCSATRWYFTKRQAIAQKTGEKTNAFLHPFRREKTKRTKTFL